VDYSTDDKSPKRRRKSSLDLSTMVYGKVPPQSKDLEEAVLGALMLESNAISVAMGKLFPEIFYVDANSRIFRAMQNLYDANSKIDLLTVVEQLKKNEELEVVGGAYYVSKLTNNVVSTANIEIHILIISQSYLKREAIKLSGELISEAYEDSSDAFDIINYADNGFQRIQQQVLIGMSKDASYYGMKVLEQHATVKATGVLGITTGFRSLDAAICGLVSPDLIIIAGRPGMGKTAFALSITYYVTVLLNIPCAWFSLEMDGVQIVRRLVSIDTGIGHGSIRNGSTTSEQDEMIGNSVDKISYSNLHIDDTAGINIRHIRTKAHLLKRKHNIGFIIVDYLQLMKGVDTKGKNREQEISEISRGLKELAKELEIPVIALSQLSREVEKRGDKMPQLSDLRESGSIEQDADEVIFLMRPEYYNMMESVDIGGREYDPLGLVIANIAKNRHGETKNVPLQFTGYSMKFSDHHQYLGVNNGFNVKAIDYSQKTDLVDDTPF
jgi:replicative DNA helicase